MSTQLSFSIRVTAGVKTVHLLGSWDNYSGQLPLSKDKSKEKSSKSSPWKGTFRFTTTILTPGKRYWYYYIIDGYHCSHNPSVPSIVESTTGRSLNVLDVPPDKSSKSSKSSSSKSSSSKDKRSSRARASISIDIPKGRPLSISQIKAPQPMSPNATRHILDVDYDDDEAIEELAAQLGCAEIDSDDEFERFEYAQSSGSPVSSDDSSLSYPSDDDSAVSGYSTPNSDLMSSTPNSDCSSCTCERYGITRKGVRVRINCGGARCGYSSGDDSCSSASDGEDEPALQSNSRRNGIVVRS